MSKKKAVAYLRTSAAANVGDDKDSPQRQLEAINRYAKREGFQVVQPPFYDAIVSGADPIEARPGFASLLTFLAENPDARTILVEDAKRFARDLMTQEIGFARLKDLGIVLVAVDHPDSFLSNEPTAVLVRQVLGAISQFDKTTTVLKLRAARDRKRAQTGKCEGRKGLAETQPEAVALARKLYRRNPATGRRRSIPEIAAELDKAGFRNGRGNRYQATAVRRMVGAEAPRRIAG